MSTNTNRSLGIAREAQRRAITGVSTSSWYDLQARGLAPKPIRLGGPSSVGWLISELEDWLEQRRAERDDKWRSVGDAAAKIVSKLEAKP